MKKYVLLFLVLYVVQTTVAQTVYQTNVLAPNIKTLQIHQPNDTFGLPIIELNSSDVLQIQFDEMSHDIKSFNYQVFQCNKDWTPSSLIYTEYIDGFDTGMIEDYESSVNTTYLYTNYRFEIPNSDISFTKSGNYVVQIYEDDNRDKPLAQACFYVVEPSVSISGNIRGNTDTELNGRMQQLDFEVALNGYPVQNPNTEIDVVVRQNNRSDNEVRNIKPTYLRGQSLLYQNNKALIFEGGYEYRRFDISSIYVLSERVEKIEYDQTHYQVYLYPDKIKPFSAYQTDFDVDGGFVINIQNAFDNSDVEADYFNVHFSIPREEPFFDGQIYIGGEYNYNLLNEASCMQYDFTSGEYFKTLLLKQGGYNYQYWFLPKGQQKADVERIEGSFWQTENQYAIYVYHRPWGGRYDKLIGIKIL